MPEQIPEAKARVGFQGAFVVDDCPYCHGTHRHGDAGTSRDNLHREADCFKGQYKLVFKEDK